MKLPNWFKIGWWVIMLIVTGFILVKRYDAITSGLSVPADVFIFIIFIALMLVPVFSEIEFFGIKLKKEIEELKTDLNLKFGDIKNEIRATQSQTLHQTIQSYGQYGPPPPDSKLPELEEEIDRLVKIKLEEHGFVNNKDFYETSEVPENNIKMFKVRFNLENELRRIWEQRFEEYQFESRFKHQPSVKVIQDLSKYEIIDKNFSRILREILSICNYAVHGEKVSDKQVDFVMNNSNNILKYLRDIK